MDRGAWVRIEVGALVRRVVAMGERDPRRLRAARLAIVAPRDLVYRTFRIVEALTEHAPGGVGGQGRPERLAR